MGALGSAAPHSGKGLPCCPSRIYPRQAPVKPSTPRGSLVLCSRCTPRRLTPSCSAPYTFIPWCRNSFPSCWAISSRCSERPPPHHGQSGRFGRQCIRPATLDRSISRLHGAREPPGSTATIVRGGMPARRTWPVTAGTELARLPATSTSNIASPRVAPITGMSSLCMGCP